MSKRILKRAMGRFAALLETVDIELDRVRVHYRNSIVENPISDEFNVDNLQRLLETRLAQANAYPADDYADPHRILLALGSHSQSEVLRTVDQRGDVILTLNREIAGLYADRPNIGGAFMTHTGLVELMLNEYLETYWEEAVAERMRHEGGQYP